MLAVGVVLGASFLASFTDWLFMNVLIHRFYDDVPEVWRRDEGPRKIILSEVIGTLASAGVVWVCLLAPGHWLSVSMAVWVAGALPVGITNYVWMRIHPAVALGHAVGWLARVLIAGGLAGWVFG
jgi:hypothetical protein